MTLWFYVTFDCFILVSDYFVCCRIQGENALLENRIWNWYSDIADASFVDCILNRSTDLTYYDFWGNEKFFGDPIVPSQLTVKPAGSTGNTSLNFRKYAGLISDDSINTGSAAIVGFQED